VRITVIALLFASAVLLPASSASASAPCRVTNGTTYTGLREAIKAAASGDTLVIHGTCAGGFAKEGGLLIDKDLTFVGTRRATLRCGCSIASGASVAMRGLTLNSYLFNSGALTLVHDVGSLGVYASSDSGSSVVVVACYFTESAMRASVIRVARSTFDRTINDYSIAGERVRIVSSTITGARPSADYDSGAVAAGHRLHITASTVAGNLNIEGTSAGVENAGIHNHVTISSSIVADNDPTDCLGIIRSGGYNIIGKLRSGFERCDFQAQPTDQLRVDPLLGPLSDNGGFAPTMPLLVGSPAIDAIPVGAVGANNAGTQLCPASGSTDERSVSRPQGSGCDIGAVEFVSGSTD
jgi:hypothetical protein